MKALVLTEYKRIELLDVPVPSIESDEVLVHVKAVEICGSDVHGMDGSTGRRIPPIVMGHETAGGIEAVGIHVGRREIEPEIVKSESDYTLKTIFGERHTNCFALKELELSGQFEMKGNGDFFCHGNLFRKWDNYL